MSKILDSILTPYIDAQTLLALLHSYANPRDCIARMVKKQELWRLKNGFYLIPSKCKTDVTDYPYEQVANLLYGPSYVSLEWALSYYQFIPERVSVITSVTTGSNKEYETPIGTFTYRHLSVNRYREGFTHREIQGQLGGFLIATKEKALADWVYCTCQGLTEEELLTDLLASKRIEMDRLKSLDVPLLHQIAKNYNAKVVTNLTRVIANL